jgi:hypothetical protein
VVNWKEVFIIFIIFGVIMNMSFGSCMAQEPRAMSKARVLRAIIGEAGGEGYRGMLAVACGIRNRGSLKGVYGLYAKHVDRASKRIWVLAAQAWEESISRDIVHGAKDWEGIKFKRPYWAKDMVITAVEGGNVFYKKIRVVQEWRDDHGNRWRTDQEGNLYDSDGNRMRREG